MNAAAFSVRLCGRIIFLASACVGLASAAHAQLVAGETSGIAINDTATHWASITNFDTPVSLEDINTGSLISGVTASLDNDGGGGLNDLSGTTAGNSITDVPSSVLVNGAYGTFPGMTLTISGLDPSLDYTLEVFSVSRNSAPDDTPIINGVSESWATGFENRNARYNETTGAFFYDVQSNGGGTLTFEIYDPTNVNPVISAFEITATAVPEPSTEAAIVGVLALGMAGFVGMRRRRSVAL